jgi:hypothetical protein
MKESKKIYLFILIVFFIACHSDDKKKQAMNDGQNNEVSVKEYVDWNAEEKQLVYNKELDEYEFTVKYIPAELIVIREMRADTGAVDKKIFGEQVREKENLHYLVFKMKAHHTDDILKKISYSAGEYSGVVQYMSFDIQKDLKLIENGDTLSCVLCHFERSYGLSPYCSFVLGFEKMKKSSTINDLIFLYEDKILNVGPVKILIKKEDLEDMPKPII